MKKFLNRLIRVKKEESAYVYAILESHAGVVSYSTVNLKKDSALRELELSFTADFSEEVQRILLELQQEIGPDNIDIADQIKKFPEWLPKGVSETSLNEELLINLFKKLENKNSLGKDLFIELFFEKNQSTRIIYENQQVDRISNGSDVGVGIRFIYQFKSVYGYTTQMDIGSIDLLACQLYEGLYHSISITSNFAPSTAQFSTSTSISMEERNAEVAKMAPILKSPHAISLGEKIDYLKRADSSVRSEISKVKQVSVIWLDSERQIYILNNQDCSTQDKKTYLQFVVQAVAEKNENGVVRTESTYESNGGFVGLEFFSQHSPESFGVKVSQRLKKLLEAVPAPSGSFPVVIGAEAGGTMIHEAVGHGLEADLACNQLSVYAGKLNQKVASSLITVVDDGTLPNKRGSYSYDDEGVASRKNVLIEEGVLKKFMSDRLSAMKFNIPLTGNGRRESFRCRPIVRMTNTYIAPGFDVPEKIIHDTISGIYVAAMGGGQVNTVTGDFVFAVNEGYLIRNGKISEPIRGATLVGNGPQVIQEIDRVGNDLGFSTGTCGKDSQGAPVTDAQPTLRIPKITVGGEVPASHYWSE